MGLFDLFKKKTSPARVPDPVPEPEPVSKEETPSTPKPDYKTYDFKVAGVAYHEAELLENIMYENDDYNMKKSELIDLDMVNERIYKYEPDFMNVELVPDPTNEHDPNAIKVVVDDVHIGYVPEKKTSKVKKILDKNEIIALACAISGGPYRYIKENYDDNDDAYEDEKCEVHFFANISITYK